MICAPALQSYRSAARDFERLGNQQTADAAAEDVARLFTSIGRADEAVPILDKLSAKTDPCKRATTAINRAEAFMEARNLDAGSAADRVRDAVQAAEAAARACPDPHRRLVAGTYALAFAIETHDGATADRFAELLEKTEPRSDALAASWRGGVLGRWALERGRAAVALTLFEEQIAIARAAGLDEEALRGHIGAGRALLALRRPQPAVTHFLAAEGLLVHALEGVPLMEGRGEFLRGHDQAVRYLVDALVDQGRVAEALRVARICRAAELASAARLQRLERLSPAQRRRWDEAVERYLQARRALEQEAEDDWKFPRSELADRRGGREIRAKEAQAALDEAYRLLGAQDFAQASPLRPLGATEVELLLFPGPPERSRWTVFVRAGERTRTVRVPARALASNVEAAGVLEAVSRDLEAATRVRILAYGDADRVDWHVVSWRGEPLIRRFEVAYALDVSAVEQNRAGAVGAGSAAGPRPDRRSAPGPDRGRRRGAGAPGLAAHASDRRPGDARRGPVDAVGGPAPSLRGAHRDRRPERHVERAARRGRRADRARRSAGGAAPPLRGGAVLLRGGDVRPGVDDGAGAGVPDLGDARRGRRDTPGSR